MCVVLHGTLFVVPVCVLYYSALCCALHFNALRCVPHCAVCALLQRTMLCCTGVCGALHGTTCAVPHRTLRVVLHCTVPCCPARHCAALLAIRCSCAHCAARQSVLHRHCSPADKH